MTKRFWTRQSYENMKKSRPAALPSEPAAKPEPAPMTGFPTHGDYEEAIPAGEAFMSRGEEPAAKPEPSTLERVREILDDDRNYQYLTRKVEEPSGQGRCDLNVLLHPHRVGTCQNWKPFMSAEEIKPIGLKILNHPRLEEWLNTGQARQLHDGLWLHYAVVCTLLKEAYADARDKHIRMTSSRPPLPRGLE